MNMHCNDFQDRVHSVYADRVVEDEWSWSEDDMVARAFFGEGARGLATLSNLEFQAFAARDRGVVEVMITDTDDYVDVVIFDHNHRWSTPHSAIEESKVVLRFRALEVSEAQVLGKAAAVQYLLGRNMMTFVNNAKLYPVNDNNEYETNTLKAFYA